MVVPPVVIIGVVNVRPRQQPTPPSSARIVAGPVTTKPDIYYLVFDRYADEQTVRAHGLEHDIDQFLTSNGFYVARDSRSNYIKTVFSLSSSLNAEYLDKIARGREHATTWAPVNHHLLRYRVGAFLRSQGYWDTHLGSWYYPRRDNPQATTNVNCYVGVPPPVIIVQGDEGPYPPETLGDAFDWRTADAVQLRERSGILNAYHLPGAAATTLYPSISPVNSFRVVFNNYFGTNLPLLPDRTIRRQSDFQPFAFDDISDVVAAAKPCCE
jgi:hypothetical protein